MELPWSRAPVETLRVAGVFNGGVSLAVWMGGATHELSRLIRSSHRLPEPRGDSTYGALLDLTRTDVVADVLAGTSAGGINGAALALAQANPNADLSILRETWAEQGRFDELLRQPFQGEPTSLLRGDAYFLPQLSATMNRLATVEGRAGGPWRDIDLIITTTLLEPAEKAVPDDLGHTTYQQVHAAQMHFGPTDFDGERLVPTARRLGLAARASAGFPLAFEPTFLPVDGAPDRTDSELRPDLGARASWADGTDRSRFAVDGGVLANTPLRQALDAIRDRPAEGPVRRLMLLVYPHAPLTSTPLTVAPSASPTVLGGLNGVLTALRSHGGQTFLEDLDAHNRTVESWRGGRENALPRTGGMAGLYRVVKTVWPRYADLRMRLSASTLADRVKFGSWTFERTRAAALRVQEEEWKTAKRLPYVPPVAPPRMGCLGDLDLEAIGPGRAGHPLQEWQWGPVVAVGVIDALQDLLRSAAVAADKRQLGKIRRARRTVINQRGVIIRQRDAFDEVWTRSPDDGTAVVEPGLDYWRARLVAYRRAMLHPTPGTAAEAGTGDPFAVLRQAAPRIYRKAGRYAGGPGRDIAGAVWRAVRAVTDDEVDAILRTLASGDGAEVSGLAAWRELLFADPVGDEPASADPTSRVLRLLLRLLALDTANWLLANIDSRGNHLPITSAQLSLGVTHPWAEASQTPVDKAAGLQLGHFAGFLKRSWRANDWIWGRLDAARMLCDVVLSPDRLLRLAATAAEQGPPAQLAERVLEQLAPAVPVPDADRRAVLEELKALFGADRDVPPTLPLLSAAAALPIQRRIIVEELPYLRGAILADRSEGQNPRSRGEMFLDLNQELLDRILEEPPAPTGRHRYESSPASEEQAAAARLRGLADTVGGAALTAFDRAGIGREGLVGEAGSDAMIKTAASTVGVAATMLASDRLGFTPVQPAAKTIRGAVQLPYWVLRGLTQGSSAARAISQLGIAAGGVLLVPGLLGKLGDVSGMATAVGTATVLSVLAYSALRTGTLLHGVVLLAAAGPLGAYLWSQTNHSGDIRSGLVGAASVLALCLALWVLASLPWPLRSPIVTIQQAWAERGEAVLLVVLVAVLVVLLPWWTLLQFGLTWHDVTAWRLRDWLTLSHEVVTACAVVLVGILLAWRRARGLRTWTRPAAGELATRAALETPAGVAATWAVVYGFGCLALTLALVVWGGSSRYWHFSEVWLATLGSVLCLLAPWWLVRRFRRRTEAELETMRPVPDDAGALVGRLQDRDRCFVYLVRQRRSGALRLTRPGRRLQQRMRRRAAMSEV